MIASNLNIPDSLKGGTIGSALQVVKEVSPLVPDNADKMRNNILHSLGPAVDEMEQDRVQFMHKKEVVKGKKGNSYQAVLNTERGTYIINGQEFVYFQGAYRLYNPKNIYKINGVYHSYIPAMSRNRVQQAGVRYRGSKKDLSKGRGVVDSGRTQYNLQNRQPSSSQKIQDNPSKLQNDFQTNPQFGGAYNANNIQNVMQNLKKAQENIKIRNNALDALMDEE